MNALHAYSLFSAGRSMIPLVTGIIVFAIIGVVLLTQWRASGERARARGRAYQRDESDPFMQGAVRERRSAVRRGGNPVAVHISDTEPTEEDAVLGWIHDRSTGGLGLEMDQEVPVNTKLKIRATNAPLTVPWVEVEVRNCAPFGKRYRIGCQFHRTPSWNVMLSLG